MRDFRQCLKGEVHCQMATLCSSKRSPQMLTKTPNFKRSMAVFPHSAAPSLCCNTSLSALRTFCRRFVALALILAFSSRNVLLQRAPWSVLIDPRLHIFCFPSDVRQRGEGSILASRQDVHLVRRCMRNSSSCMLSFVSLYVRLA